MDELKIVTLEGKEYTVLDEIQTDNTTYVYFVNPNNLIDFCIRKLVDESLDSAFKYALEYSIIDLVSSSRAIHPDTVDAFNETVLK